MSPLDRVSLGSRVGGCEDSWPLDDNPPSSLGFETVEFADMLAELDQMGETHASVTS